MNHYLKAVLRHGENDAQKECDGFLVQADAEYFK